MSGSGVRRTATAAVATLSACGVLAATAPAATTGTVLGGETSEGWPVVVELSKNGKQVVRASAGIHLTCKSGGVVNVPDVYRKLTVSPSGKLGTKFGPTTQRNNDGTTTDYEGSISGKLNKARTSASGKWTLKWTDHDTAGAITDTCESGSISWKAKA